MSEKSKSERQSKPLYFQEDPDITDLILMVENKELYVTKVILMRSSPVFRVMFTSDFKEKNESTISFPEKKYEDFVLFLRSFHPGEHLELNISVIESILPLAREYAIDVLMKNCEEWLLVDVKTRTEDVHYQAKCFYLAAVYNFDELYNKMLEKLRTAAVNTYENVPSFKMLPSEDKACLLKKRCEDVEKNNADLEKQISNIKNNINKYRITCTKCGNPTNISEGDKNRLLYQNYYPEPSTGRYRVFKKKLVKKTDGQLPKGATFNNLDNSSYMNLFALSINCTYFRDVHISRILTFLN
ncbi:uncharacterized protein LOC134246708 [Saccostrea cucullata]|uniref:uncharacterized protein LOC134246708 n=1 Tax=Saccostrea cuccullata TaxID=36930 RepID=UPI002ED2A0F3